MRAQDRPKGSDRPPDGVATTQYQRVVQAAATMMQTERILPSVEDAARLTEVTVDVARTLFPSRDDLCAAVAEDTILRLTDFMGQRASADSARGPVAQFAAMLFAYVDWCHDHPHDAGLLQQNNLPRCCEEVYRRYGRSLLELWQSMLARAADEGRLREGMTPQQAAFQSTALITGLGRIIAGRGEDYLSVAMDRAGIYAAAVTTLRFHLEALFPGCSLGEDLPDEPG